MKIIGIGTGVFIGGGGGGGGGVLSSSTCDNLDHKDIERPK